MEEKHQAVELLNNLIYVERANVEVYSKVMEHTDEPAWNAQLRAILRDHRDSVVRLSEEVEGRGGRPNQRGHDHDNMLVIAEVTGSAKNDPFAVKALKEKEEQALLSYQTLLEGNQIDDSTRELITGQLLPRIQDHLVQIEGLLRAV